MSSDTFSDTFLLDNILDAKDFKYRHHVSKTAKGYKYVVMFDKNEYSLYNKYLENIPSIPVVIGHLVKSKGFFNTCEISYNLMMKIEEYIDSFTKNKYWKDLCSKPDYNYNMFKVRMLPHFNHESKEWQAACDKALKDNYPSQLTTDSKADDYAKEKELAGADFNNNFASYSILDISEYKKTQQLSLVVLNLFILKFTKQALRLFLNLLISPDNADIIKTVEIWNEVKKLMVDNANIRKVVEYACYYSLYILRHEETVMFSQIKNKYRVLMKLYEAAAIPTFSWSHLENNPHIQQITDDTDIHKCIPFYLHGSRRLCTENEFKRRFDLATGGAFRDISLRQYGAAITGSILIPCVHKNPLEKIFESVKFNRTRKCHYNSEYPFMTDAPANAEEESFMNYLDYYYPGYSSLTDEDFINQLFKEEPVEDEIKYEDEDDGIKLSKGIKLNINSSNVNDEKESNEKESDEKESNDQSDEKMPLLIKKENPLVAGDVIDKSKVKIDYNQLADIDISITTKNLETYKANVMIIYEKIKSNCKHRGDVHIQEIKTITQFKYKIYGSGLPRPIDIFRVPYDPAKMVKKFHVHAVRMYYDDEITMFRSCVSCLLSGVGESYKWFSCNKTPADVLLKYAQRGISIILNSKERDAIANYMMANERWCKLMLMHGLKSNDIYTVINSTNTFFRPDLYNCGIRMTLRNFDLPLINPTFTRVVTEKNYTLMDFGETLTHTNRLIIEPNPKIITEAMKFL